MVRSSLHIPTLALALALLTLLLAGPVLGQEGVEDIDVLLNKAQRAAESGRLKEGLKLYKMVLEQEDVIRAYVSVPPGPYLYSNNT